MCIERGSFPGIGGGNDHDNDNDKYNDNDNDNDQYIIPFLKIPMTGYRATLTGTNKKTRAQASGYLFIKTRQGKRARGRAPSLLSCLSLFRGRHSGSEEILSWRRQDCKNLRCSCPGSAMFLSRVSGFFAFIYPRKEDIMVFRGIFNDRNEGDRVGYGEQ